ncbi:MAG: helicase [Blastocatellia bacterium]
MSTRLRPNKTDTYALGEIFGPSGLIAQRHETYEFRPGQLAMAEAVAKAFDEGRHLLVEAGTGTGKTLAYLVPAIAYARKEKKRVVISTGTKNLQEQLMEKDIPFLKKIFPGKFSAAYMKGRGNYACLYRAAKAEHQPILDGLDQMGHFATVRHWLAETTTGDRRELADLPEDLPFWNRLNARSDTCIGQKCVEFERCFITRMRARAEDADIVIVNHHLFFADLSVRGNQYGRVIPDYSVVIFDEAHLIEDVASEYFGFQVSNFQIADLLRDLEMLSIDEAAGMRKISKSTVRLGTLSEQLWSRFTSARLDGRYPIRPEIFLQSGKPTPLGEIYEGIDELLQRLSTLLEPLAGDSAETESLLRRVRQVRFELEFIVTQTEKNFVYWLERKGRGFYLKSSPIDVSELLREKLFERIESCVLTSATLAGGSGFDFIRSRLGLDDANTETLVAESSFDYEQQALLYLPRSMPDPRSPEFTQIAANEIVRILHLTQGRAFVLCTSNQSMSALFELVSSRISFPSFLQGTMSKAALIEAYRATKNAVLFATASFWQGVDVQGEQLSCVIIDKLPFAVPTDPVVAARTRHIEESGGRAFSIYSLPQAIITLKQGVGRLIRSRSDRGVVAILDPRLKTKSYGRQFLSGLPRMRITDDPEEIKALFDKLALDRVG